MSKSLMLSAAVAATMFSGCATVIDGGDKFTRITSDISPMKFEVRDKRGNVVATGDTPEWVKLDAGGSLFSREAFTVQAISPDGGGIVKGTFKSQINHTTWLSNMIPVYGLGGQVVDWFTGAIWTTPDTFELRSPVFDESADLSPKEDPESNRKSGLLPRLWDSITLIESQSDLAMVQAAP